VSTTHTPGPWVIEEALGEGNRFCGYEIEQQRKQGNFVFRGDVARVSEAEHIKGITRDEAHANARLIAAAPDLLAKLVNARALLDDPRLFQSEWDLRKHDEPLVLFTRRIDEAIEANEALHRELREMDEVIARATATETQS
jgi:hypothetical protein